MQGILVNQTVGLAIRSSLRKKFKNGGAPAGIPNAYNPNTTFSQEELDAVDSLTLYENVSVHDLDKLKNLRQLSISAGNSYFSTQLSNEDICSLGKLRKLETLSLRGVSGFDTIDLSFFGEKFWGLDVVSCQDLVRIENLNEEITNFTCIDNTRLANKDEIVRATISNAEYMISYNLDVTLAPRMFKSMKNRGSFLHENQKGFIAENVNFGEIISGHSVKKHSFNSIKSVQEKVEQISKQVIGDKMNVKEKFTALYMWMCKNVVYDDEVLEREKQGAKGRRHLIAKLNLDGNMVNLCGGSLGTNSCINAFLYQTCVCEGYTRALQYLCEYNGIKTSIVHCHSKSENTVDKNGKVIPDDERIMNHSIIQLELDGRVLYCDPTWDAQGFQKVEMLNKERDIPGRYAFSYFLLTEEQMTKRDHKNMKSSKPMKSAQEMSHNDKWNLINSVEGK